MEEWFIIQKINSDDEFALFAAFCFASVIVFGIVVVIYDFFKNRK